MERLTTNKNVSEMGMLELALNCCYIAEDGNARYRDYEIDVDGRDFIRDITAYLAKDVLPLQDESFDEEMMEDLIIDPSTDVRGLIAVFYRNMWAMAELREKLKRYEDAEEHGSYGKWIPVSERLPEESLNSVIGWDTYRNRCCFVQYLGGRFVLGDDIDSVNVTAWMPLPEPYRERDVDYGEM